jgi:hypothetical protein
MATRVIDLARLVAGRRQAQIGSDILGSPKPPGIIDRGVKGHRGERSNSRHPHPSPTNLAVSRGAMEGTIQRLNLDVYFAPRAEQGLERELQRRE